MGNSSSQAQQPTRSLHKVLPERAPSQRLRVTNNGAILHSGGTLSGRHHHQADMEDFRLRSSSTLQHRPHPHEPPDMLAAGGKRFGSEPDLRFLPGARDHDSPAKQRIARNQMRENKHAAKVLTKNLARKKYKAPAPPPEGDSPGPESSSPESCQWDSGKDQPARRMRLFKTRAETRRSLLAQTPHPEYYKPVLPAPSPRRLSSPEFQEELLQAARRLRPTRKIDPPEMRGDGSGQESTPEPPHTPAPANNKHWEILPPLSRHDREKENPVKTFYFGMEQREIKQCRPPSSDSDVPEDEVDSGGIALQLRPTLPKKQLEIPRFSPTAAWRLLSAQTSAPVMHMHMQLREERERPIPPPHSSLDKSGDSGISGDASPGAQDTWTPQQDLEESSSDGGDPPGRPHPFSPRAVFSLSLPRDDRLCNALFAGSGDESPQALPRETPPSYNSLQKLRRSMSGAFGRKDGERNAPLDENWVLSRSVPNSLNTTHKLAPWDKDPSTSSPSTPDRPSFSYLASGGHVMYLPQLEPRRDSNIHRERSYSASALLPRPHHDEMRQLGRTPSPPPRLPPASPPTDEEERRGKGRRFTFQSTVRQIERRRLAEKLSREAEEKERRRLGELEAMRRVEEEFQRKRAREKANIRQQLWLFSQHSSLPASWGDARAEPDGAPSPSPQGQGPSTQVLSEFREARREYRDYRQPRYMDSGPESLLQIESRRATVHPKAVYDMPKSTQVYITQHTGDAPTGASTPRSSTSDNYRRDFACGARPTGRSVASSDSEMSSHSQPRQHHRARSTSPASSLGCLKPLSKFEKSTDPNRDPIVPVKAPGARIYSLHPFARAQKSYRPIAFNPSGQPANKVAQPVS